MNVRIALGSFFPSYVCQEIARGVLEEAERLRGENPQLSLEVWESKTYDRFLREHRLVKFDGALAFGNYWHVVFGGKGWPPLSTLGIPWINTSNRFYHPDVPKVVQDDIAIGRLAGRFLARKQPQAFAFLGFPDEFFFSEERRLGFIQGAGIAPEQLIDAPRVRGESLHHPGSAQDALMQDWIASLPRNTAIFAANDEKGANLLSRLSAFPRRVPADLTLIGADDDPAFTKRTNLALSSIHIGGAAVGRRALRTLTEWVLTGKAPPPVTLMNSAVIVERRSTDQAAVEDPAIDRLLRQLRLQPQAEYSMEEWSRLARLSERSLQRRFRLATGSTPQQYIKILRIDQARRLLAESSLPITQVAELAGFGDSKWFHRAFQAATGLSPRAYRQRILSQSPDNGL